jgi:hypothetical protein
MITNQAIDQIVLSREILDSCIKQEVETEVKRLVAEAKIQLDKKIPEIVAGLCINLGKQVDMSGFGNMLTIRVSMTK